MFPKASLANNNAIKGHSNRVLSLQTGETDHFYFCPKHIHYFTNAFIHKTPGPDQSCYINIHSPWFTWVPKDTKQNYKGFEAGQGTIAREDTKGS